MQHPCCGKEIMALYLVQHAKALSGGADPGLSDEGKTDANRIATVARDYHVPVGGIIHSGRKRALETAQIYAIILGPGIPVEENPCMSPKDDIVGFAAGLDLSKNHMYVGHLPFMEKLTSYLVTGEASRPVFKFQNAGIVCIDLNQDTQTPVIIWSLMPHIQ
jgi:phosphohistidine phosphatase